MRRFTIPAAVLALCLPLACSPDDDSGIHTDGGGDYPDGPACSSPPYCTTDGRTVVRCNPATGVVELSETCYPSRACVGGACVAAVCPPGNSECVDGHTMRRCRPDGQDWENVDCGLDMGCNAASGLCEARCAMRVFVLLDSSGSMSESEPTKWSQAREAMAAILASPTSADIEWGFGHFSTDDDCGVDDLATYPVPEANASIINSFLSSEDPSGNTPLVASLQWLADDTTANIKDTDYHNAILVISDGVDTCYGEDCLTLCGFNMGCLMDCENRNSTAAVDDLSLVTQRLRDEFQVRTFVIGFGTDASEEQLSVIADNGGTGLGWIEAGNEAELTAALQAIVDEMWECNPIII
jgi:hypothetical protein